MTPKTWPKTTGELSFWYAETGGPPAPRAPLPGDISVDVCIIGGGFTGLWAAHYLRAAAPELSIAIVEAEFAGFGASGRNGGWLTGGFAWPHERYLASGSPEGLRAMVTAMTGTVDEIISVTMRHGIDARIRRTEELLIATNPAQLARLQSELARRAHWAETGLRALSAAELHTRITIPGALGAMLVPGVARIQPALLVQGLARMTEATGTVIYEATRARKILPGRVITTRGTVTARTILRATEGYSVTLPGHERDWLPLNSAQIITAPLSDEVWQKIGWQAYEIVGDFANTYCYCQRTDDGRIAVGSRGIPYRLNNRLDHRGTPDDETIRRLIAILHRHFPAAREAAIDHAWCGVLGVPRDWCATVGFDPKTRIGQAGGYVGVGVSTANLAGRTLADLALGRDSDLTRLPWVNRAVRKWEPEPLRWLGLRAMYALLNAADRAEARGTGPSWLATLGNRITGR